MNFDLTDDQKMLVETVQSFVKKDSPVERMRRLRSDPIGWEKSVWKQMGELGWLGVMFPESVGGLGMSFVEVGLIIEQLGTTLVPEPYLPSVVLAGTALARAGSAEQQQRWLSPMLAGDTSLALGFVEEQSRFDVTNVRTRAEKKGSKYTLRGAKRFVLNGHAAEQIIVSARTSGSEIDASGISLFVLDREQPGLKIRPVDCMDSKKAALLDLDGVEVEADRLLGQEGEAAALLDLIHDYGAAAACAEGSGVMQTVLMMTRNYLTERKQFGVAIGTFQALQHRMVDMFVETELAKSTAILAMLKVSDENRDERQRAISTAKVQLGLSGGYVVRQGTQLHGGIGVTDEHDVGLYFKRMHILSILFGDDVFHTQRFAGLPGFAQKVEAA
ncbi:MAG TPA: acyl-CoA dehydrogenase [Polyangiaceae bacterium]|nr:acyl-CoA dehydrogenase [Polyangiaceae bacterium]